MRLEGELKSGQTGEGILAARKKLRTKSVVLCTIALAAYLLLRTQWTNRRKLKQILSKRNPSVAVWGGGNSRPITWCTLGDNPDNFWPSFRVTKTKDIVQKARLSNFVNTITPLWFYVTRILGQKHIFFSKSILSPLLFLLVRIRLMQKKTKFWNFGFLENKREIV